MYRSFQVLRVSQCRELRLACVRGVHEGQVAEKQLGRTQLETRPYSRVKGMMGSTEAVWVGQQVWSS